MEATDDNTHTQLQMKAEGKPTGRNQGSPQEDRPLAGGGSGFKWRPAG